MRVKQSQLLKFATGPEPSVRLKVVVVVVVVEVVVVGVVVEVVVVGVVVEVVVVGVVVEVVVVGVVVKVVLSNVVVGSTVVEFSRPSRRNPRRRSSCSTISANSALALSHSCEPSACSIA